MIEIVPYSGVSEKTHGRYEGFEPKFIEVIFNQTNRNTQTCVFLPLLIILARYESPTSNPLIEDFIIIGKQLEELGYVCSKVM
jgi:hypothetical protein